jgi:hypothetical protein
MTGTPAAWVLAVCLAGAIAVPAGAQDLDADGLPDAIEDALLARFVPTLILSAGECDGLPASFVPGLDDPRLAARDGTLYGQVTPRPDTLPGGAAIEIKFFHLWVRDCGRPSHALDAEHVSALLTAPSLTAPPDDWRAVYWYASAHAGTICDASSGARAPALRAERVGPYVYVSRGKHASYLDPGHCPWGCGSDSCRPDRVLPRGAVINLGEPDAPLNGATWMHSHRWRLANSLASDFVPATRADLDRAHPLQVLALRLGLRAHQAPILGGNTGLDAMLTAAGAAGVAVAAAGDATATAVDASAVAVRAAAAGVATALGKTAGAVGRFLRVSR